MAETPSSTSATGKLGVPTLLLVVGIASAAIGILTYHSGSSSIGPEKDNAGAYETIEVGYVFALVAAPLIFLGIAWSLPNAGLVRNTAVLGTLICLVATYVFAANYPLHINVQGSGQADRTLTVVYLYALGLVLLMIGHFLGTAHVARHYVPRPEPPPAPSRARASPAPTTVMVTQPAASPLAASSAKRPFRGQIITLIDVEGIGPAYARRLGEAGVKDSQQLLEADPDDLARRTGISVLLILAWQSQVDLDRMATIDNQHAELLLRAGVLSVHQLAHETPESVTRRVEAYLGTVERAPTTKPVTKDLARRWIEDARALTADDEVPRWALPRYAEPRPVREATPWRGQVLNVVEIEGVGPAYADRLSRAGIRTNRDLLGANAATLAQATGIPKASILSWQSMADLDRLKSVNNQYAELLVRSGVHSVEQLAAEDPAVVLRRVRSYLATVERAPTTQPVDEALCIDWARDAKDLAGPDAVPAWALPRFVEPEPAPGAPAAPKGAEATMTEATPRPAPRMGFAGPGIDIIDVEGIGSTYASKLYPLGIKWMHELRVADPGDVATRAGISERLIRTWQTMADLDRLQTVSNQHAEVLFRCGIRSVGELARETPDAVVRRVESYLGRIQTRPIQERVDADLAKRWIAEAQQVLRATSN